MDAKVLRVVQELDVTTGQTAHLVAIEVDDVGIVYAPITFEVYKVLSGRCAHRSFLTTEVPYSFRQPKDGTATYSSDVDEEGAVEY